MLEGIFDGIQRPLDVIESEAGSFITRGIEVPSLNRDKKWAFKPTAQKGDRLTGGDIIGTVQETIIVEHRIMVPPEISGTLEDIREGEFTVTEPVAKLRTDNGETVDIAMMQKWPVRKTRPYKEKLAPEEPMATGQRVIDAFFPVTKGGTACIPGPFGSGKTVVQHQLAKWADAEIVVYGVPGIKRPQDRGTPHEEDGAHSQHIQHAGGCPGSIRLYRHHHRGVFQGYGIQRRTYGRFHIPLGGSPSRDVRKA